MDRLNSLFETPGKWWHLWLSGLIETFSMLENRIERRLVLRTKKLGGRAIKWVSPSMDSLPDRLIFLPGGILFMVETKRPGKVPSKKQEAVHGIFRALGFKVYWLDTLEKVEAFFKKFELGLL